MQNHLYLLNRIGALNFFSIAKTASKEIGAMIRSVKFLSPEVALYLCKSTMGPCTKYFCRVWVLLLTATWICYISYRNGYVGLVDFRIS